MEGSSDFPNVTSGEGWAAGHLEDLGEGPGFRKVRNAGTVEAVYLVVGGKDGYVGRDGRVPEGEEQRVRALHDLGGHG